MMGSDWCGVHAVARSLHNEASQRSHKTKGVSKNKLTAREYDEATWATRSFGVFAEQGIAVALHMSVAEEIATACGGGMYGVDLRPRPQGVRCA